MTTDARHPASDGHISGSVLSPKPGGENSELPTAAIVIPTVGRPCLRSAVVSVLNQRGCDARPVVVLDAPDRETEVRRELAGLSYRLLLSDHAGAPAARNAGLADVREEFVGYLDDDDTYHSDKCRRQIEAISRSTDPSRTFSVTWSEFVREDGTVMRRRVDQFDSSRETLAEYLVRRRRLRHGAVCLNTPALLGPRELMQEVTWDVALRKHQDWDLIIRLASATDGRFVLVDEFLVRVHQGSPGSLSRLSDWTAGTRWLEKHTDLLSGRDRADFVLLHVLLPAVLARSSDGWARARHLWPRHIPHAAALLRFTSGVVLRR